MTPEQILELADEAEFDKHRYWNYDGSSRLVTFARLIEAHTREECAKQVEQDLYPDDSQKPYTQQYNSCIKRLAEKIRSGA